MGKGKKIMSSVYEAHRKGDLGEGEELLFLVMSGFVLKEDGSSRTIHTDQSILCYPASLQSPWP